MTNDILENLQAILDEQGKSDMRPVEIEALDKDAFLKVKETLQRIGIQGTGEDDERVLWQSCHLLHKKGHYYICHFKHLFLLDNKVGKTILTEDDQNRVYYIANLLQTWNLVKLKDTIPEPKKTMIRIVSYSEKKNWVLRTKYEMSKKLNGNKEEAV